MRRETIHLEFDLTRTALIVVHLGIARELRSLNDGMDYRPRKFSMGEAPSH